MAPQPLVAIRLSMIIFIKMVKPFTINNFRPSAFNVIALKQKRTSAPAGESTPGTLAAESGLWLNHVLSIAAATLWEVIRVGSRTTRVAARARYPCEWNWSRGALDCRPGGGLGPKAVVDHGAEGRS